MKHLLRANGRWGKAGVVRATPGTLEFGVTRFARWDRGLRPAVVSIWTPLKSSFPPLGLGPSVGGISPSLGAVGCAPGHEFRRTVLSVDSLPYREREGPRG